MVTDLGVPGDDELWRGRLGVSGDFWRGDPNTGINVTIVRRIWNVFRAGLWGTFTGRIRSERLRSRSRIRTGISLSLNAVELPSSGLSRGKRSPEFLLRGAENLAEVALKLFVLGVEVEPLSQLSLDSNFSHCRGSFLRYSSILENCDTFRLGNVLFCFDP